MKALYVVVISAAMFLNVCSAAERPEMKNSNERIGYSVGYGLVADLKKQGVEVDQESLIRGIRDAMTGAGPLMPQDEMTETLSDLRKSMAAAQREELNQTAEKNLRQEEAFLAENSKKEGVHTLPSGLQYKVIREGSGRTPQEDDTVTVNYRGTLIDGNEFDSSFQRNKPATFRVDRVIPGWKQALQMMKEGAKWELFVPARLAYGTRGVGTRIPPGSALIFELELISIGAAK